MISHLGVNPVREVKHPRENKVIITVVIINGEVFQVYVKVDVVVLFIKNVKNRVLI